jgi:hypothetical protein
MFMSIPLYGCNARMRTRYDNDHTLIFAQAAHKLFHARSSNL